MVSLMKNLGYLFLMFSLLPLTITARDTITAGDNKACRFDAIYQFGDSISDAGNLIREGPVGARSYAARYPYGESFFRRATGRCSDGLLMIDYFATALGLPLLNPYLQSGASFHQGVNFAVAGSTALPPSFFRERNIHAPSTDSHLNVQLDWFHRHLNSSCHTLTDCRNKLQHSLVFMGEIGGNDYNYAFFQNKPMQEIHTYVPHVVGSITHGVREVIKAGARHIVVPGNFPVGCIPIYLTSFHSQNRRAYDDMGCLLGLNEFARYHNNYLKGALQGLRQEFPNVVIVYGDYYNAFKSVLRRSRSLGFDQSSVLRACCGVVRAPYNYDGSRMCGSQGVPVCSDPSRHIHWDGVHLTQAAYRNMANWLINDFRSAKIQC
ncbi:hypothetical protein MKW92_020106 [Papaver armeniacum]|nr:hypothetical protein MKW92_020106 [Papaver armeniacum]